MKAFKKIFYKKFNFDPTNKKKICYYKEKSKIFWLQLIFLVSKEKF